MSPEFGGGASRKRPTSGKADEAGGLVRSTRRAGRGGRAVQAKGGKPAKTAKGGKPGKTARNTRPAQEHSAQQGGDLGVKEAAHEKPARGRRKARANGVVEKDKGDVMVEEERENEPGHEKPARGRRKARANGGIEKDKGDVMVEDELENEPATGAQKPAARRAKSNTNRPKETKGQRGKRETGRLASLRKRGGDRLDVTEEGGSRKRGRGAADVNADTPAAGAEGQEEVDESALVLHHESPPDDDERAGASEEEGQVESVKPARKARQTRVEATPAAKETRRRKRAATRRYKYATLPKSRKKRKGAARPTVGADVETGAQEGDVSPSPEISSQESSSREEESEPTKTNTTSRRNLRRQTSKSGEGSESKSGPDPLDLDLRQSSRDTATRKRFLGRPVIEAEEEEDGESSESVPPSQLEQSKGSRAIKTTKTNAAKTDARAEKRRRGRKQGRSGREEEGGLETKRTRKASVAERASDEVVSVDDGDVPDEHAQGGTPADMSLRAEPAIKSILKASTSRRRTSGESGRIHPSSSSSSKSTKSSSSLSDHHHHHLIIIIVVVVISSIMIINFFGWIIAPCCRAQQVPRGKQRGSQCRGEAGATRTTRVTSPRPGSVCRPSASRRRRRCTGRRTSPNSGRRRHSGSGRSCRGRAASGPQTSLSRPTPPPRPRCLPRQVALTRPPWKHPLTTHRR